MKRLSDARIANIRALLPEAMEYYEKRQKGCTPW